MKPVPSSGFGGAETGDVAMPDLLATVPQDMGGYALSKYQFEQHYMQVGDQARDTSTVSEGKEAIHVFASEMAAPPDIALDPDLTPNEGDHDSPARMGTNYHID